MENIILQQITVSELTEIISEAVRDELSQIEKPEPEPVFITRKEAAQLLGISLPTLHFWTKDGKIPAFRIGNRVRYKKSEVIESLNKIRT